MTLSLLVLLALIIAGIGYFCYKVGYSKGNQDGMDMQGILKAFSDSKSDDE